jgi:alpha 1,3-glucosidase
MIISISFMTQDFHPSCEPKSGSEVFVGELRLIPLKSQAQNRPRRLPIMRPLAAGALLLPLFLQPVFAVKAGDFKTCSQSAFCRRGRALSARAAESAGSWRSPYSVDSSSISIAPDQASFTAGVKSELYPDVKFELDVRIHDDGVVRVRMDERDGLFKRYDEAASWALIKEPEISNAIKWTVGKKEVKAVYGEKKEQVEVLVQFEPLVVRMKRNGKEQVVLNGKGLLHMEHFRKKGDKVEEISEGEDAQKVLTVDPNAWFEGQEEDGYWEETFKTWTDSKPKGEQVPWAVPSNISVCNTRSRIPVIGYHIPEPRACLRHSSARHPFGLAHHNW